MDDEPDFLERAKTFLEKEEEKLDVETAVSAGEGLETLEEENYDAIVSDYQMPGMDGLEFLKTVRGERGSNIPFIIFTGKGREEVAIEALNLGADRYLRKGGSPKSQYGVLARAIVQEVERGELERIHSSLDDVIEVLPDPMYVIDVEDYRIQRANSMATAQKGQTCYEATHGRDRPCHEGGDQTFSCPLQEVTETGEPTTVEHTHEVNGEKRIHEVHAAPIVDEDGTVVEMVESLIDTTERKEAEERKDFLNTLLRQDLKNKYQIIYGYYQLLEEEVDLPEEQRKYLKKSLKAASEADEILDMAKKLDKIEGTKRITEKDIIKVLKFVIDNVSGLVGKKGIEIEENYPETISEVKGDYSLNTLFTQLLVTRIKLGECSKIRIKARERGEDILLIIEDDGKKLPGDVKDLFTEKAYIGDTSGVGGVRYYILNEIARHNNAKIEVKDSELGGARFDVHLQKA